MAVIATHDITLYGKVGVHGITLRPLSDEHLPLLYRWNADSEVVYWSDTGNADAFDPQEVRGMYGVISQDAFCFLAEVDGVPIGDFWLQRMNIPSIRDRFPGQDVRRIEATIGEKDMWGKGIGSAIMGMLMDFAFCQERVDILYCFAADYNVRSQRMLMRKGFSPCGEEELGPESLRARKEFHYMLTRQEYMERCGGQ